MPCLSCSPTRIRLKFPVHKKKNLNTQTAVEQYKNGLSTLYILYYLFLQTFASEQYLDKCNILSWRWTPGPLVCATQGPLVNFREAPVWRHKIRFFSGIFPPTFLIQLASGRDRKKVAWTTLSNTAWQYLNTKQQY